MKRIYRALPLLVVTILFSKEAKPYHSTPNRDYDVHHTRIEIEIDIPKREISGNVTHTITPLSSDLKRITLDTEDTDIHSVTLNGTLIQTYQLSGAKLQIDFDEGYSWEDTLFVYIEYSSRPTAGLYFVYPDSVYPGKHLQAWTQGEQMYNHHWVPIYDYPNDRATFECILTVDKPLLAVSNGELVFIEDNGPSRTFHWRESFPMVSYLISFAIGEYKKIEHNTEDTAIAYWIYPELSRADALRSFGRTPEMISLFGEYTGVEYPFEKYDQVLIEDFMWGGMENITLTHLTDRTMHTDSARPDHSSDWLVAHELAHQWYGDLITTRNWANIWLNEGITSFMELIWVEHKLGYDEAEYYRLGELRGTLRADRSSRRPMVYFEYEESNDLFDGNVYAKGAVVMNMLRRYLGEDAFLRGLQYYTKNNALKNVETSDLKKAFEEATGQNLYWFFDQWIYSPGLPELKINSSYSRRDSLLTLSIQQTRTGTTTSLFRLPMTILIDDGELTRHTIVLDKKEAKFTFPSRGAPQMIVVDEGNQIPKYLTFNRTIKELIYQLNHALHVLDRVWAAEQLGKKSASSSIAEALTQSIETDPFWGVRVEAANAIGKLKPRTGAKSLMDLYRKQRDSRVQRACIRALKKYKDKDVGHFLFEVIQNNPKDYIIRDAINSLTKADESSAMEVIEIALTTDAHEDVVRKAAISALAKIKTEENYRRLLALATYGGTTWNARVTAVSHLGSYIKKYPEVLDVIVNYLDDPNYKVRREAINLIGRHGQLEHLKAMLEIADDDAINARQFKSTIDNIKKRQKALKSKTRIGKKLRELNRMVDLIENRAAEKQK